MVWSLSPVDAVTDEDAYYIFAIGTYKVGRKGCDVIISKDKGVSRIHAELVVDAMASSGHPKRKCPFSVIDCSKYGTFIQRSFASLKEKVHELPNKKTSLKDGDMISFGTGNATFRFCFVPLFILVCCLKPFQVPTVLQERISAIGACVTHTWSADCTHVLVDQSMPVNADIVNAIVAKKPVVLSDWIEIVAGKKIRTEIPSYSTYLPTLALDEISVKIADPKCRENCFEGYTFVLDLACKYKFGDKLQPLLEVGGAKIISLESFCSSSQGLKNTESDWLVHVIPERSFDYHYSKLNSLRRITEVNIACAVFSGHMDRSVVQSPSVLVSTSCSTDETVVADSDAEVEMLQGAATRHTGDNKHEPHVDLSTVDVITKSETGGHIACSMENDVKLDMAKGEEPEDTNTDIIYSQGLIVKNASMPASFLSSPNNGVVDFKCFRKLAGVESGNSFSNLIPFSQHPYTDSDLRSEVVESMHQEKKRKQMEKVAEDLFNSSKAKRRGVIGSVRGIIAHN